MAGNINLNLKTGAEGAGAAGAGQAAGAGGRGVAAGGRAEGVHRAGLQVAGERGPRGGGPQVSEVGIDAFIIISRRRTFNLGQYFALCTNLVEICQTFDIGCGQNQKYTKVLHNRSTDPKKLCEGKIQKPKFKGRILIIYSLHYS